MKKLVGFIGQQRMELNLHNSSESKELRRETATKLLAGLMTAVDERLTKDVAVKMAIEYADELLKQLGEGK